MKNEELDEVLRHGYTLVYVQDGNVLPNDGLVGRRVISANEFIAVRNDLVGPDYPKFVNFEDLET